MSTRPVSLTEAPAGYTDWLSELKSRIHTAQQRAALAVNRELVLLYWQAGHPVAASATGLGSESDRATGARSAHRVSRHEGFFAAQPQVHESIRWCLAGV